MSLADAVAVAVTAAMVFMWLMTVVGCRREAQRRQFATSGSVVRLEYLIKFAFFCCQSFHIRNLR